MRKYYVTYLPTNSTDVNDIWEDIIELKEDDSKHQPKFDLNITR